MWNHVTDWCFVVIYYSGVIAELHLLHIKLSSSIQSYRTHSLLFSTLYCITLLSSKHLYSNDTVPFDFFPCNDCLLSLTSSSQYSTYNLRVKETRWRSCWMVANFQWQRSMHAVPSKYQDEMKMDGVGLSRSSLTHPLDIHILFLVYYD